MSETKTRPLPEAGAKWNIPQLTDRLKAAGESLETMVGTYGAGDNVPAIDPMSLHIYYLKQGMKDEQRPHEQDEVYYVVNGSRTLCVGHEPQKKVPLETGDLVYVPKNTCHTFVGDGEITLLVFFAPNYTGPQHDKSYYNCPEHGTDT